MNSMSYPCTDTSCSESCPDHRLILVSAGHHAMSPVVVLLLSILGLIHCLRSSLLFLQDVFTCKSSYDMSNTIVLICRTCRISPCKSSDTESESCQEEFCSAISPPWYLAPDIQAACFRNHSWCLSGRQVGGAALPLCSLCHLFTCFKYFSLVVTKVATP